MKHKLVYFVFIALFTFCAAEALLRLTGRYATYSETIGLKYSTYYNTICPTWYLVHGADRTYTPPNSDFSYAYTTNKFGVRECDFEKNKKDSSIRIFVTGDSFSEGQGAPYDSTWPHLLSNYLAKDGINAEVLNTGVAGSDPIYNYVLHRDLLKGYKSDYLVISLNSSDFVDYIMRGGFERFHSDGTTHYRKSPWYEPIYHHSYFARGFIEFVGRFPFRGIFATERELCVGADEATACYASVIDSFSNLLKPDSTRIIVLLYSTPSDIRYTNHENIKFRECFLELEKSLNEKGIPCINLWDEIKLNLADKNYLLYSYTHDAHFKPYGYNLIAKSVEKKIIEKGLISGNKNAQ